MRESNQVTIKLESMQDGSSHTHMYSGEWFRKERSVFIRYSEQVGDGDSKPGEIRTLIRYRPGELSIVRRGAIHSEQLFVQGWRREGRYQSAMATFKLDTETSLLVLHTGDKSNAPHAIRSTSLAAAEGDNDQQLPKELPFMLEWQYELYVGEQLSGRFHNRLHIQEETHK